MKDNRTMDDGTKDDGTKDHGTKDDDMTRNPMISVVNV